MNSYQKTKMLNEIKKAVYQIAEGIFEEIEKEIVAYTYTDIEKRQIVKASKVRMAIRSLRCETLQRIKNIGYEYEGEENEQ